MTGDNTPVIIGVAQRSWPERDVARTPLEALEEVALGAVSDCASAQVLPAIDAIAQLPFLLASLPELAPMMPRNIGAVLGERLGLEAVNYGAVAGGNLPQEMINSLAKAVVEGRHQAVLVCGTEQMNTFLGALRAGDTPPDWSTGREDDAAMLSTVADVISAPTEFAHGLFEPIVTYPLIETALRHARGLDLETHRQGLGQLVSDMSRVANANPLAWKRELVSPEAALSTDNGNRMICYPYTKIMNAIASVDMAAAAILTTAKTARALRVPQEQWVYLWGGADTHEPGFFSERPALHRSEALAAAAQAVFSQTGLELEDIDLFDLYSCFPSAVEVACEALGLSPSDPRGLTVTGGMTLFGGPGNSYSLHAIAETVQRLRADRQRRALVTANGGYLTKHALGIYSSQPPPRGWRPQDRADLQARLDARARPSLVETFDGPMTVVAYTLRYSRGEPATGIIVGELEDGRRCLAHSEATPAVFDQLLAQDCVGIKGHVTGEEGINRFRF